MIKWVRIYQKEGGEVGEGSYRWGLEELAANSGSEGLSLGDGDLRSRVQSAVSQVIFIPDKHGDWGRGRW